MNRSQIKIIINQVKDLFINDASGHDYYHTFRVYVNALKIAKTENDVNIDLIVLGALLHDVDDHKLFKTTNYENARKFMHKAYIDEAIIEEVIKIIETVSFSKGLTPTSLEGKIVQDADRLDAIGAIGIARAFAYGGSTGSPMYDPDGGRSSSIDHFYEKLFKLESLMNTSSAKSIARERTNFMKDFVKQFLEDWGK